MMKSIQTTHALLPDNSIVSRHVRIIDGDSLEIKGTKIRLHGIDAPEYEQNCYYLDGTKWPCGRIAVKKLRAYINGRPVICHKIETDQYQRMIANCKISQGQSINSWLVENGWALSYQRYSDAYINQQSLAKKNKQGIWQGYFLRPEKWRQYNRKS